MSQPSVTEQLEPPPAVACSDLLECSTRLRKMSHEHKAIHEKSTDLWERAYHLGAAVALQDAQMEVLRCVIEKHSNDAICDGGPQSTDLK